jgi:hypothetical protein
MDKNNFSIFLRNNINDTFWNNYIELVRNEMIHYQLMALNDEIEGAPKSYCLENFKKATIALHFEFDVQRRPYRCKDTHLLRHDPPLHLAL